MLSRVGHLTLFITLLIMAQLMIPTAYGYTIRDYDLYGGGWLKTLIADSDPSVSVTIPNIPLIQIPRIGTPIIIGPEIGGWKPPSVENPPDTDVNTGTDTSTGAGTSSSCDPANPATWGQCLAEQMWNFISGLIDSVLNSIRNAFDYITNSIAYIGSQIAQFIINVFSTIANAILTGIETIINVPSQFLNGYWELTIGSLVDILAGLGPMKPFVAPLAYTVLIVETIPVMYALGYLIKYAIEAVKIVIGGVL